jgi:hypothetical protein
MILRNYDNVMINFKLMSSNGSYPNAYVGFGGDSLKLTYTNGGVSDFNSSCSVVPFLRFKTSENKYNDLNEWGLSNLVCGNDNNPTTYDSYTIENLSNAKPLSQAVDDVVYDETTQTYSRTYRKTYMANEDLVINCIGVAYSIYNSSVLVYRKVLDAPIEVPANANFTLSFTMKASATPNKPANYEATASVE